MNCNLGLKWQTSHDPDVENSAWKQLERNNDDNWERYKEIDRAVATITFECGQWRTVIQKRDEALLIEKKMREMKILKETERER